MNELLKKIESKELTEDIDLFYLGSALMTKVLKAKTKGEKKVLVEKKTGKSS